MYVSHVIKPVICALMSMITIALNAKMGTYKIELLRLKSLKDVSKLVLLERFSVMNFVRSVIKLANYAQLDMIIIVLNVQMDL